MSYPRYGPMLFLTVLVMAIMALPPLSFASTTDESLAGRIDAYVADQMNASSIPGVAVSISQSGEIIHAKGYGHTSGDESPVTPQTLLGIGSTGKSITALAIMQLVEAGMIELDTPVQTYIPWFSLADRETSAQITVRHLLNMTSGIPATAGGEAFRSTVSMTAEEAIRALHDADPAFEPGSTFEYVNANYVILGHMIEAVTDQSYSEYIKANIFEPLDMHSTFTDLELAKQEGFEDGHRYWFGQPVSHAMKQLRSLVPAGYIISTAENLSNYLSMYLNNGEYAGKTILSADSIAEMHRGTVDAPLGPWADGASAKYAMGWYVGGPWGNGSIVFHPGSEPSFTAMMMLDHERDLAVVTLMNSATEIPFPGAAGALRVLPAGIMSILVGDEAGTVSLDRFYLIFNVVVLTIVVAQSLMLIRLIRRNRAVGANPVRPRSLRQRSGAILPLLWEFGLAVVFLLAPSLLGMSWPSLMLWIPDLAIVAIVIAGLSLITGFVRVWNLGWIVRQNVIRPWWESWNKQTANERAVPSQQPEDRKPVA